MGGIAIAPRPVRPGEAELDSAKVKDSVLYAVAVEGPHRCLPGSNCSGLCVFRMASLLDWVALESRNRSK